MIDKVQRLDIVLLNDLLPQLNKACKHPKTYNIIMGMHEFHESKINQVFLCEQ